VHQPPPESDAPNSSHIEAVADTGGNTAVEGDTGSGILGATSLEGGDAARQFTQCGLRRLPEQREVA
jgi:hypothetical protein